MLLEFDLCAGQVAEPPRSRTVPLPKTWSVVRNVRSMVDDALVGRPESLRQSARLVASELVENVIKYGEPLPDGSEPAVLIRHCDGKLVISSRNGVTSDDHVRRIFEILARLGADDTQTVYIEAILQSMQLRKQSSMLGLLRIAAEARFDLSAKYAEGVLDIVATKGAQ